MKARLAAAAVIAVSGVSAPSAMGATITSDRECYREGATGTFVGTGFQPRQPIALSVDGQQVDTGPASLAGAVAASVTVTQIPSSEKIRMLTMTQTTNTALTATKVFTETKVYVVTKPGTFKPGRRLRIRAGGFYSAGPTLYGHVRGPKRRNLRIGKVKGACGKVSATKKVILKRHDGPGIYRVQFDTLKRFSGLRTSAPVCGITPPGPFCVRGYRIVRRILRLSRASEFSSPVFGGPAKARPDYARIL